ncbi:hypothetical protein FRB90_011020 [Tulasnella sp. 427]|nr:hypothetical protein FRB90_011020 [Tulasnella sp. 427]
MDDLAIHRKGSGQSAFIHPEALVNLRPSFSKFEGTSLIPNIQRLDLYCHHPSTAWNALLFAGPSLKALTLFQRLPNPSVVGTVRRVLKTLTSPSTEFKLQEFGIRFLAPQDFGPSLGAALSDFIRSQPTILTLGLNLHINSTWIKAIFESVFELRSLTLNFCLCPSNSELEVIVSLVSDFFPSMEQLLFHQMLWPNTDVSTIPCLPMPPSLLNCRMLKTLAWPYLDLTRLDQAAIEAMGNAWRHMETLSLLPPSLSTHNINGISPSALQHMSLVFPPSLRSFSASIVFAPESTLDISKPGASFPSLQSLHVGRSVIPRVGLYHFSEFLGTITPIDAVIQFSQPMETEQVQLWNSARALLQMVHRTKKRTRLELLREQEASSR